MPLTSRLNSRSCVTKPPSEKLPGGRARWFAALCACTFFQAACESSPSGDGAGSGGSAGVGGEESGGTGTGGGAGSGGVSGNGGTAGEGGTVATGGASVGGASGSAGEAGAASGNGGTAGGAGANGGTGGSNTEACEPLLNEELTDPLTISVVNNRDTTVWLKASGSCDFEPKIVEMPDARVVNWRPWYNCEDYVETNTCPQGAACGESTVRLGANESVEFAWRGRDSVRTSFTPECEPQPDCLDKTCSRQVLAPAGTYTVSMLGEVYATCTGDNCDTCVDTAGKCVSFDFLDLSDLMSTAPLSHSFEYPQILSQDASLVFEIN